MRIGEILKDQQPEVYKKLKSDKKEKRGKENLSFSDLRQLMKKDSYYRGKGGSIKQRSWNK
ncbi:hypothetical protein HAHI6034_10975 [Hathewaya histolytica]|uniref:Uncharacterized protein n=1 Tax=Hathewaya histolytica TaxID=1498 RepID=A0A4U9RAJ8_HATHI|nr:hypothetical protein [Hathewaya histolytica]VTQ88624.1 Uncharacterised protein [Hathewaya histolytica]